MAVMVVHAVEERGHQRFLAYLKEEWEGNPPSALRRGPAFALRATAGKLADRRAPCGPLLRPVYAVGPTRHRPVDRARA